MLYKNQVKIMQGNEACAVAALDVGVRFFAGYPITPSTEIAEIMSIHLPKLGGKFIQMEDEIASISAIIGSSLAGEKSMTATSGPGFSLMQENIGYACLTEVPLLIVNVMRGGPSTGLPTAPSQADVMQVRWGTHGDHYMIALCPTSVEEAYELTIMCVNLSEKYRVPAVLLMDEVVAHMREKVDFKKYEENVVIDRVTGTTQEVHWPYKAGYDVAPAFVPFGNGYRYHVTGLIHDEFGLPTSNPEEVDKLLTRLRDKVMLTVDDFSIVKESYIEGADYVFIAYGAVARSACEAAAMLREKGYKVGVASIITIWPFPDNKIRKILGNMKMAIVPEMNQGQLVREVQRVNSYCCSLDGNSCNVLSYQRYDGELITPFELFDNFLKEVEK